MDTFSSFTEDLTIKMPTFNDQMREAVESTTGVHALIVEIAAIHEGLTANFNNYSAKELSEAVDSWTQPFPKPIILNHDLEVDPLGRVMSAAMSSESDGSKFINLQFAITDPSAIAKVADKRYLTGSVGGKSDESLCSVCGKDWSEASVFNMPCKHERGKTYKGKLAFLDRKQISFHEYSFVNNPADKRSIVKNFSTTGNVDEWVDSAKVFDLSMDRPHIYAFSEGETVDVLATLRKREAAPLYHQLKGSFLSALAVELNENATNEEELKVNEEHDDDVLDIVEQLSDDLTVTDTVTEEESGAEDASDDNVETSQEGEESDGAEEEASEDPDANEATDEETDETTDGEDSEEESDETEEAEVEDSDSEEEADAQGQERPRDKDRESGFSKPNVKAAKDSKRDHDKTRDADDTDDNLQEANDELMQKISSLELQVSEQTATNAQLLEENTRLKSALKRTLAERVVDQKIALNLISVEERESELEEHSTRTAASLADSLRDLSGMARQDGKTNALPPEIKTKGQAVADESGNTIDDIEEETSATQNPEDIFVDAFMGRRPL